MPSPLDGDVTRGFGTETVANALRRLEELGEWTTVGELARDMGKRPARLLPYLKGAWCLEAEYESVFDGVLLIEDEDDGRELRPAEVRVCVVQGDDRNRPLRGTGLALLGLGAYTTTEIDERLDLIEHALDAEKPPRDVAALQSARGKLLRWRQILDSESH